MARLGRHENPGEYTPEGQPYQGTLIRETRSSKWPSVTSFAQELDRDQAYISRIELNRIRPNRAFLAEIADKIGIPLKVLEETPVHPRISDSQVQKESQRVRSLSSLGRQVEEIVRDAQLTSNQGRLARQLILDTSRAIVLRLGSSGIH